MVEARITGNPFAVTRHPLFTIDTHGFNRFYRQWDLAPEGSHFVFSQPVVREDLRVFVIHNRSADVRARVAVQ